MDLTRIYIYFGMTHRIINTHWIINATRITIIKNAEQYDALQTSCWKNSEIELEWKKKSNTFHKQELTKTDKHGIYFGSDYYICAELVCKRNARYSRILWNSQYTQRRKLTLTTSYEITCALRSYYDPNCDSCEGFIHLFRMLFIVWEMSRRTISEPWKKNWIKIFVLHTKNTRFIFRKWQNVKIFRM